MTTKKLTESETTNDIKNCGIVMPISAIDNCTAEHWKDVYKILCDAISNANFKPRLVSESEESGIIQKKIIQNLYDDPIVIVDVSGKNPNVMFELGLRLAFDKPTIIVKDNITDYSFDTSPIEHLSYPRDLRYQSILDFKEKLKDKILATYKKSTTDTNYTTFLKHFGTFKVAKLDETVVGKDEFILQSIEELKSEFRTQLVRNKPRNEISEDSTKTLVIENRIKDYLIEKGLNSVFDISSLGLFEECLIFVEKFPEVRKICRNRNEVERTINSIIELPF